MKRYQPKEIESKWQARWKKDDLYASKLDSSKKFYVLAEFAYPSGDLHTGHWFTWAGADVYARFKRMQGYDVFFPNGFDAFGLPAENAAIKRQIHPQDWTLSNVEKMKKQYETLGGSFTFDHEVITCLPGYYRWNQWIFLKMYEKGLAYRGSYISNWCNVCQTVLANEGVENGACWRCGTQVEQKEVPQWFFKITDYADRLIWPENPSVDWPKAVRQAQNDWIGKKEGIFIDYKVEGTDETITVFTTRPDTNFGATFIALAPEHPLISKLTTVDQKQAVKEYIEEASKKSEIERKENREKTGVFTGSYAVNDLTGEKMPVWISDFVLIGFGTGALVGVPGHDKRDFEFAKKFDLEIKRVVLGKDGDSSPVTKIEQVQEEEGKIINSGFLDGLDIHEATQKIMDYMEEKGYGKRAVTYHLHDWSVSRQRYWGTPVPMVHCSKCGIVPVPEEDLPIELPYDVDYTPKGKPPLASNEKWLNVKCPKCGGEAKRDAETMDTFVDSSWYFFRFISPNYPKALVDPDLVDKIMPVDIYFGGAEHTLGHTLYSRFVTKFLHDLGITKYEEYAKKRINHGIVLGPDGQKMSKSKGNVVNPDDEVKKYGTDAVRAYVIFFMPYDGTGPWVSDSIWGPFRFLEKVWNLAEMVKEYSPSEEDQVFLNKTVKKVTEDIEQIKFNTALAALMEWSNYLTKKEKISKKEFKTLLLLLAPIAPFMSEELWEGLGEEYSIHKQSWPKFDSNQLQGSKVEIVVQVNGKVREKLVIDSDMVKNEMDIEKMAKESTKVAKFLEGKEVKKTIYVPGKIINLVVN